MRLDFGDTIIATLNPIDVVEEVFHHSKLPFERIGSDDIAFEFIGSWCDMKGWVSFKRDNNSMMITCTFDTRVPEKLIPNFYELIARVNEGLWIGMFDLSSLDNTISFRQTVLLPESNEFSKLQVEKLAGSAFTECEKFYPAMQSVIWGGKTPLEAFNSSIFETVGEA